MNRRQLLRINCRSGWHRLCRKARLSRVQFPTLFVRTQTLPPEAFPGVIAPLRQAEVARPEFRGDVCYGDLKLSSRYHLSPLAGFTTLAFPPHRSQHRRCRTCHDGSGELSSSAVAEFSYYANDRDACRRSAVCRSDFWQ